MTALGKGGSVTREGSHVDCAVYLHGVGDRFLHIVEEAYARKTQVTGRHNFADLRYGHTVDVHERAAEDKARDLRGCESRLVRARGFLGSGAVGRRWRPKAPKHPVSWPTKRLRSHRPSFGW